MGEIGDLERSFSWLMAYLGINRHTMILQVYLESFSYVLLSYLVE